MSTPLVSILIPCYNAAPWLRPSLESALDQTHPSTEIIVVDDGSSDESLTIARSFAERGIRVFSQKNLGASAARNHALREAQGDYFQFLDADDLISPGKIAAQVELLRQKPAGLLATCMWGRFNTSVQEAQFVDHTVFRDFKPLEFLRLTAETAAMMHPSAWLVPRSVAQQAGPWNESLSLNDDGEYFCRVVLASSGIAFCPDARARSFYRSGLPGSLSRQRGQRARISQFRALELVEGHLLAAERTPDMRHAIAAQWRRFVHDFFPEPSQLMAQAEARALALDGIAIGPPPMGPKTKAVASLIGWRTTWRLKHFLRR